MHRRKLLEEDASGGVEGHVVIGNDGESGIFLATNATFPQNISIGTLSVGISDTEDCNSDAHGSAPKFQFDDPVTYNIDELGMIEGAEKGWFQQSIRELQANSTLPVSLADLVGGSETEYGLAVYLLSSDEELLGCASMEKLDDVDKAAEYVELLFGMSQDQEAVTMAKEAPSSGSKIGLFVSAIAAVGIAFVLGDAFAL